MWHWDPIVESIAYDVGVVVTSYHRFDLSRRDRTLSSAAVVWSPGKWIRNLLPEGSLMIRM